MTLRIIAAGNPVGSDDAIAFHLADKLGGEFDVIKVLDFAEGAVSLGDEVVLIDSINFGGAAGDVRKLNPLEVYETNNVSHESLKAIEKHASKFSLIGIQPAQTGLGDKLSEELSEKLEDITEELKKVLVEIV